MKGEIVGAWPSLRLPAHHAKGIALAALAYFILPFDAIPDAIAAVGFTDDAAVIAAALLALGSRITKEHLRRADEWLNSP